MKKIIVRSALLLIAAAVILVTAGCSPRTPAQPRLRLEITAPAARASVTDPIVTVTGIVSDPAARVTVRETPVQVGSDGAFSHPVDMNYGSNSIGVRATLEGQNPVTRTLTITRNLVLDVSSPLDKSSAAEEIVTVSGNISDTAAKVFINGEEISIGEDGSFSSPVKLYYLTTTINITTSLEGVDPITRLVTVTRAQ